MRKDDIKEAQQKDVSNFTVTIERNGTITVSNGNVSMNVSKSIWSNAIANPIRKD